jgi:hypothetical protein
MKCGDLSAFESLRKSGDESPHFITRNDRILVLRDSPFRDSLNSTVVSGGGGGAALGFCG